MSARLSAQAMCSAVWPAGSRVLSSDGRAPRTMGIADARATLTARCSGVGVGLRSLSSVPGRPDEPEGAAAGLGGASEASRPGRSLLSAVPSASASEIVPACDQRTVVVA